MTINILLIDDSRGDYLLTESILQDIPDQQYELQWVAEMSEGLEALNQRDYDVVLLDYHIGSDTAVDFLTLMNSMEINLPVIVLTGIFNYHKDLAVAERGATDFIEKERLDSRILERAIRYALLNHEKIKLQKQLERAQEQLIQSDKMASIGQLAAGIAHEINNPAGFVASNMNMLRKLVIELSDHLDAFKAGAESLSSNTEKRELSAIVDTLFKDGVIQDIGDIAEESLDGMERIKSIVLDLKSFCHDGSNKVYKTADINSAIQSTLNIVRNEIKYFADVEMDLGVVPTLVCNIAQINQVVMNMAVNSVHAIRKKSENRRGLIKITSKADAKHLFIEIEDDGCGIPKENLRRIMDPFFTTKDVGEGTGLGLSIAFRIVKEHGGDIHVESEVDHGALFSISLPLNNSEPVT